jgi:hypothetical protein
MAPAVLEHPEARTKRSKLLIETSVQRDERQSIPDYAETYERYLRTIQAEEARLGRQLSMREVEKVNREVFAPMNRAVWER